MPIHNADIAQRFTEMANLLEIKGDNPFRIRAYRNAAQVIEDSADELATLVATDKDLSELAGIGQELAAKIAEIVASGTCAALEKLRGTLPPHITDLLTLPGLGPKRVRTLYQKLDIGDLDALRQAAEGGRIRELPGLGEKTEQHILEALKAQANTSRRYLRALVRPYVDSLTNYLQAVKGVNRVTVAGSYRRGRETIGDVDLLVLTDHPPELMQAFVSYDEVREVLAHGETKSSVTLKSGVQVDVRVVPADSYGAALHYFTGSKAHNIAMRKRAQQRHWKLNEYGLFDGEQVVAGQTEEAVFAALDLPFIPPSLRENRGELEAAMDDRLPDLITVESIRGNLHAHTSASDGRHSVAEMAAAAQQAGHEYLAITDHSKRLTVAHGLDEERLIEQIEEIDALNEQLHNFTILKGCEVDILEDGRLDLDGAVLKLLDIVIVAVHHKFNLLQDEQTERIMRAMDHPCTTFVAHPTGRLLLQRPPYAVDVARLIAHARQRGCFLELNGNPQRLDLNDVHCQACRQAGVPLVINTDAHQIDDHNHLVAGIAQARRGWLTAADVINTLPLKKLRRRLAATRHS